MMNAIEMTRHAETRIRQRGIDQEDVNLIIEFGTRTNEGYVLLKKDVQKIEKLTKKLVQDLYRRVNTAVIEQGGMILSIYRLGKSKRRKMLKFQ